MSFISYAQNYEDVILWRALKHIDSGFYIDIGAAWSEKDSVTKAFYDRGWKGINIEPNPIFYYQLQVERYNDINLKVAISNGLGSKVINLVSDTGLSTLDDAIANKHIATGLVVEKQLVQTKTLDCIWEDYVSQDQEVHFLKIDVEGFEDAVLRGKNWSTRRPWIIVVEATLPLSQIENYQSWEPIIRNADYIFAYADGLNRFYVATEHSDLLTAFQYPPNVFDGFIPYQQLLADQCAESAKVRVEEAESRAGELAVRVEEAESRAGELAVRVEEAESRAGELAVRVEEAESRAGELAVRAEQIENQVSQLHAELDAVYSSRSWRITWPLRTVKLLICSVFSFPQGVLQTLKTTLKILLRPLILATMRAILRRPAIRRRINAQLYHHPRLRHRLVLVAQNTGLIPRGATPSSMPGTQYDPFRLNQLPESACRIYWELKEAVEGRKNKEGT